MDSWLTDELLQEIIRPVDKATVLSSHAIKSKALGVIPVTSLSGGTKTLLLIDHELEKIFYAATCEDNCAKWILRIAKKHKEDKRNDWGKKHYDKKENGRQHQILCC